MGRKMIATGASPWLTSRRREPRRGERSLANLEVTICDLKFSMSLNTDQLRALDKQHLWHPFTPMSLWLDSEPLVITRAEGFYLFDSDGNKYLDGVSSLWCNVHGHRHPRLDAAVREQLDRVAHSTLLGVSHPGAAELAARLIQIAPPGLSRVFYSDSGSTAVEVALKMAFQYWQHRGGQHVR